MSIPEHPNTNPALLRWYALKVFFNRVRTVDEELRVSGHETYMPVSYRLVGEDSDGEPQYRTEPLASLLFLHIDPSEVKQLRKEYFGRFLFYGSADEEGKWVPAAIPDAEMSMFRKITEVADPRLEFLPYDPKVYATGKKVRVTGGPFAGAEGVIKRIRHDRRFLVEIKGICLVATSYIPREFLEPR